MLKTGRKGLQALFFLLNNYMDILLLMLLLQIKHWYADFFIQTYDQTVKKGVYGDLVGLSHSLDHMLWTMFALFAFSLYQYLPLADVLIISAVEAVIHYHIDWFKVKFGSKDSTTPRYWREFGLDQFAHQVTYLGIIWYFLI